MTNTLDLLSQFEDEITTSNRLPYLQIQNPPNLSLADIKKYGTPFGWFIPAEQAELAEFNALMIINLLESLLVKTLLNQEK